MIELTKMRWVRHVVLMMKSNAHKMLIGETDNLGNLGIDGRIILRQFLDSL
jgi:hypothetical protein